MNISVDKIVTIHYELLCRWMDTLVVSSMHKEKMVRCMFPGLVWQCRSKSLDQLLLDSSPGR